MFYGTINSDATIDNRSPFSNNFSVTRGETNNGTGSYAVTFNEYVHYSPSVVATANSSTTGNSYVGVEYYISETNPLQIQFITTEQCGNQNDWTFSFHARTGQSLTFDASKNQTLALTPQIVTFNGNQVLTISTNIDGLDCTAQPGTGSYTAHLDKGTVLLGVLGNGSREDTMTLSLPQSYEIGSQTWTLTGWTFGGRSGKDGTQWTGADGAPATYTLALGSASPMTTPESFVIMAVCGDQVLTTDPVVRLSNVPPAGLSM